MTSYGRNKNLKDEIKKNERRPIIAPAIAVRLLKIIASNFVQEQLNKPPILGQSLERQAGQFNSEGAVA